MVLERLERQTNPDGYDRGTAQTNIKHVFAAGDVHRRHGYVAARYMCRGSASEHLFFKLDPVTVVDFLHLHMTGLNTIRNNRKEAPALILNVRSN